ncbi:3-hydroxyacyl-CoA dehydrogenase NAD-binding domain-containing protein [Pseudemcibacter aquimaris]|uniref:3-hydroxyacyl-CoA dehydrogenase NAD-binding domain-containing protein n=1 Tax=Pseudemcibacter aquimaris TaxID=2857064 RepID=UPI002012B4BA|nr:3-hydroxyacyl-CoA dehydrogenase NAD-binding domain-containing protein [Pseudemcibacter aquimaris]MCC3861552.1 enoyl-CoA hydratase/isomerase family protein [Pseudemcibacter aquimaris]WDU58321.1 enoyl-CoA hydratase/isomerase family protein [Pseudemcibacter aquimaris]
MSIVSTSINDNIAVVTIDNPPVNALSHAVRDGVSKALSELNNNDTVNAVVIHCAGRTFCAGADITEFGKPPVSPTLPELMAEMDEFSKPLIAAMHGTALGGGFEVGLACHYRVMDGRAKVGLPEVNLGLMPGAGGTQRLPRLIGAEKSLEMITSGKPIKAEKALSLGVADLVSDDLLCDAINFAKDKTVRRIRDLKCDAGEELFADFKKKIARKSRGFLAPFAAIDAVKVACDLDFDAGIEFEREKFMELVASSHSKAQRHLFFAERQAAKVDGIDKNTATRDINNVAVVGGGIMGCGIAVNFLSSGMAVTLLEITGDAANAAKQKIEKIYASNVSKGRMTDTQMAAAMNALSVTTSYDDLSDSDLMIEAVFEDMNIKKEVLSKLDNVAKDGAIIATNTSFLDIDEMATATSRVSDVIGLHFFSPAHIMPLLEIVKTDNTSNEVIATAFKLAKKIRKTPVLSGVCYGFIANRMSSCYGREAGLLLLEGASVEQVDQTMYDFGMPMGMFSMLDMAGIDIGVMARSKLSDDAYDKRAFSVHAALVDAGHKGQKTGAGFYEYDGRDKKKHALVEELAEEFAKKYNIKRDDISSKEIEERCIFALINEGYKIVEEGIAQRTSDIDVVYAFAFGFPRYKGGPMHYVEHLGLKYVLKRINEFAAKYGDRWWRPSPLLVKLAEESEENV